MKTHTIVLSLLGFCLVAITALSGIYISHVEAQEVDGLEVVGGASLDGSEASLIASRFVQQVNILNQVNIKENADKLFGSTAFQSLVDYSRPIPEEPVGRSNPFAPF